MTILHVVNSNIYSGTEKVAIGIIKSMPDDIQSLYLTLKGQIETKLLEMEIPYVAVEEITPDVIKDTIESFKPDVIHAHNYTMSVMCAKVTSSVPIISHIHGTPNWMKKINPMALNYSGVCKNFSRILTVSDSVEKESWFRDKMKGKTMVIGDPFNAAKVFEKGYLAGTELTKEKLEAYKSDLLFVGTLCEEKNPLEFIYIVGEIAKTNKDIKATMVGGGDLGGKCIKLISKLGLEDNIKMAGFQPNPYTYMNETKILVVPSLSEGTAMVALEAMTFAKPVLASRVGMLPTILEEDCGYLCGTGKKPVDRECFVNSAIELLTVEAQYKKKSDGARKRARTYDNYASYMQLMADIYYETATK